ncbi:MAG: NYN domain-containing protein [Stigonema ocellatum SAG 48.90 = DSM 106950]|nr:NYN domain-containing protein [Stigonema ocellatum SAG 48.90 = DSM 106950]
MSNGVASQEQTLLLDLLRATSQNQEVYPILQNNLDKLDDDFALLLRQWVSDQFAKEPVKAINITRIILRFSTLIQRFEQGNLGNNLEIAIAGYEAVLPIITRETFPKEWDTIQQALVTAYQQRQQMLSRTIANLRQNTVQNQTQISTLTEQFQQELQQAKLQVDELKTAITQLKQESGNSHKTQQLACLMADFRELKQRQSFLQQLAIKAKVLPTPHHFNTAIFYDMENLTMGRHNPNLRNLSLKKIKQNIEQNSLVSKIAIQCAYADWSNPQLRALKQEVQEIGIETVQIFDYGHKKNAADIQLAIDVIELAYIRPSLQVFVIVSGDGAFAFLAKKLHEHGKTVIGCAYEKQLNRFFKSVCDDFLPIPAPQEIINQMQVTQVNNNGTANLANDNNNSSYDDIFVITQQSLECLKQSHEQKNQLRQGGIPISQVYEFLKSKIPDFAERWQKKGCSQLTKFLKKTLEGTDICLSSNNQMLILREMSTTRSHESSNSIQL